MSELIAPRIILASILSRKSKYDSNFIAALRDCGRMSTKKETKKKNWEITECLGEDWPDTLEIAQLCMHKR